MPAFQRDYPKRLCTRLLHSQVGTKIESKNGASEFSLRGTKSGCCKNKLSLSMGTQLRNIALLELFPYLGEAIHGKTS